MSYIDLKPLHPKNKLLLYRRYVLSKLSLHFTVAAIPKTWIIEKIDTLVNNYIRKWLEIPVSGTLSNVYLTNNKFGLNILPPSVRFTQCQSVLRNALKSSPNDSIKELWKSTNNHTNLQYDDYNSTKDVLKKFQCAQEDKLKDQLICQGSFFISVSKHSLSPLNHIWSTSQSKLPKNIFNFTVRCINNNLPTRKNLRRWGISSSSDCSFCLYPETFLHVVAGCQNYLNRFTWRHDSILKFLARTFQAVSNCKLLVDLPGFESPSIITGDDYRPDFLLTTLDKWLYIVELSQLTVGYESDLENNVNRKKAKYIDLIEQLDKNFSTVKFVNLSMSPLGVFDKECHTFLEMLNDLRLENDTNNIVSRE